MFSSRHITWRPEVLSFVILVMDAITCRYSACLSWLGMNSDHLFTSLNANSRYPRHLHSIPPPMSWHYSGYASMIIPNAKDTAVSAPVHLKVYIDNQVFPAAKAAPLIYTPYSTATCVTSRQVRFGTELKCQHICSSMI